MQRPSRLVTGYPGLQLRCLALDAINFATERLHLSLLRRELLRERFARLTLLLERSCERLDQPVLRISTLLVGSHRRLCSFRPRRHLLDPLRELLQVFGKCRYVVRLVTRQLLKRGQDLAHLLLHEHRHVSAKRAERLLLLREVASHLVYLAAV